ncbi:glutathione S-transferase family protein [Prosthecomicrobium sp. N25]|uniref:glutathione S-transferase family protein n=1 Tax=Prosthecomicrobium sp. N25 TaxID=3129254 RepID=UPI003077D64C
MILHAHPFSSYCQKVLTALYEAGTAFTYQHLDFGDPAAREAFAALWPVMRMPVLVDGDRIVVESTIIIEHLDLHHPGPARMVPGDPAAALEARLLDRAFDNYVMTPMQRVVADFMRRPEIRDPTGVAEARSLLDRAYGWLDGRLRGRTWAAGESFGLADCAAAPALFYADWVQPIPPSCGRLRDYRAQLLARPSFARAVDEARPYRHFFPPGAPDRD